MTFNPNIPAAGDLLSDSQLDLLNNNAVLDAVFDEDHYTFSDGTVNQGKHQHVSSPDLTADPGTGADPRLYGLSPPGTNLPVLQFSQAPTNAVRSPVTKLQSSSALITINAGANIVVFNFTGFTYATGTLQACGSVLNVHCFSPFYWRAGSLPGQVGNLNSSFLIPNWNGVTPQLRIQNTSGGPVDIFWTLDFMRLV